MPGPRSKRKRTEIESTTPPPAVPVRRRGRELSQTPGPEPATEGEKNEAGGGSLETDSATPAFKSTTHIDEKSKSIESKFTAKEESADSQTEAGLKLEKEKSDEGNDHVDTSEIVKKSEHLSSSLQLTNKNVECAVKDNNISSQPLTNRSEIPKHDGDSALKSSKSTEARQERIRDLLSHRKLILERLRQGRAMAKRRIEVLHKRHPEKTNETDEEEINAYRDIAKEATSLARKQAKSEQGDPNDKRTSVSLRRGASVGKRMNAALSSLATATGAGATTVSAGAAAVPVAAPPATLSQQPIQSASKMFRPSDQPSIVAVPSSTSISRPVMSGVQFALPKGDNSQAGLSVAASNRLGNKPAKASSNASARGASSSAERKTLPLHAGISKPSLPPNQLSKPSVSLPEAVALRQRRKDIQNKLAALLVQQGRAGVDIGVSAKPQTQHPIDASQSNLSGKGQTIMSRSHRATLCRKPDDPSPLPVRRRTHWDTLLEEMRWMATDFREERKWKIASARILGKSIYNSDIESASPFLKCIERDALDATKVSGTGCAENCLQTTNSNKGSSFNTENSRRPRRHYSALSANDLSVALNAAKLTARMVGDLTVSNTANGNFAPSVCGDGDANRLDCHRSKSENKLADSSHLAAASVEFSGRVADGDNATTDNQESSRRNGNSGLDEAHPISSLPSDKSATFENITSRVNRIIEKVRSPEGKTKGGSSAKLQISGFEFSNGQRKAIEAVDDLWTRVGAGAVLGGPLSSGKTIIACSLLWRHRERGPQLVLCPPSSMIRWMHELGRFKDLLRRSVAPATCTNNTSVTVDGEISFKANDVVVCEYASLSRIRQSALLGFSSVVVDCRYPSGYRGARVSSCTEKKQCIVESEANSPPRELTSISWWSLLASARTGTAVNRLLIDSVSSPDDTFIFRGLPDRQHLNLLAFRVAWTYDVIEFRLQRWTIEKTILAWARKLIKDSGETGSSLDLVRKLLLNKIELLHLHVGGAKLLEDVVPPRGVNTWWELRGCELTGIQRSSYDKACIELRAALSANHDRSNKHLRPQIDPSDAVTNALISLRKKCFHADLASILRSPLVRSRLVSYESSTRLTRKAVNSPSQPCLELALSIVQGSSKLKALLIILAHESEIGVRSSEGIHSLVGNVQKVLPKPRQKRPTNIARKIAILAVLPEAQILISLLLNAIGIRHELLLRHRVSIPEKDSMENDIQLGTLAWSDAQLVLSKFNDESCDDVNVVVASPVSLAGDHGGLGVEMADMIVCVDEDWSGRGELVLKAVIARCLSRKDHFKDDGCRLLKLVAAGTCEEKFLSSSSNEGRRRRAQRRAHNKIGWPWPLNSYGSFVAPGKLPDDIADVVEECWSSRQPNKDSFAFPGCNIFDCRDKDLSEILATKQQLPPLLTSRGDLLFLPSASKDEDCRVEMDIMEKFLEKEELASPHFWSPQRSIPLVQNWVSILPAPPLKFPVGFLVHFDARISTRYHLRKFGRVSLNKESGVDLQESCGAVAHGENVSAAVNENLKADGSEVMKATHHKPEPVSLGPSLLFYGRPLPPPPVRATAPEKKSSKRSQAQFPVTMNNVLEQRVNAFASSFSSTAIAAVQDGCQGSEGLVYFPPLFPRLLESFIVATENVESIVTSLSSTKDNSTSNERSLKRNAEFTFYRDSKRPRVKDESIPNNHSAQYTLDIIPVSAEQRIITEDEASRSDAASVLLDLNDDYGLAGIGAVPLPRESAVFASQLCLETASNCMLSRNTLGDTWLARLAPCDGEDVEMIDQLARRTADAQSVVLLVSRKRSRGDPGLIAAHVPRPHQGPTTIQSNATVPLTIGGNGLFLENNGGKKKKTAGIQRDGTFGSSAFNKLPGFDLSQAARPGITMQRPLLMTKNKDSFRNRLQPSRQSAHGPNLFESPHFRGAVLRVQNRVSNRMARQTWQSNAAFEAGPGLPLHIYKQPSQGNSSIFYVDPNVWTSLVKRLKTVKSRTGDEAIELANAQRASLRRSLVAPCRVDFGPFQAGFLSGTSGTTSIAPPRPRFGVALPMGVKVPQGMKEQTSTWGKSDDAKLQRCVVRFGMNWNLASRLIGGFQDIIHATGHGVHSYHASRAAKSCRDRWQSLARTHPVMAQEVRQTERAQRENASFRGKQILENDAEAKRVPLPTPQVSTVGHQSYFGVPQLFSDDDRSILLPLGDDFTRDNELSELEESMNILDDEADVHESLIDLLDTKMQAKPKRSFAALVSAKDKIRISPIVIPGVVSGSPPSIAPSHPSHMEAVQTSVTSSWTGGRTDMWPLQLLDAADRQRAAVASATPRSVPPPRAAPTAARPFSGPATATTTASPTGRSPPPSSNPPNHRNVPTAVSVPRPSSSPYPPPAVPASHAPRASPLPHHHSSRASPPRVAQSRGTPGPHPPNAATKQSFAPPLAKQPASTASASAPSQPPAASRGVPKLASPTSTLSGSEKPPPS